MRCQRSRPDATWLSDWVDTGLEKFLATSDGVLVKPPKFFVTMQSKLKLLQRRLSRKQKRSENYEKQRITAVIA